MTSLLINLIRINKNVFSFVLLIVLCITFACKAQNLLNKPQKIVIDKERNRLLVSNFGTGDIIQIDSSGYQRFFKRNAEFNDGMEIVGNTVYGAYFSWVGGQGKVKGYDLDTRQLVMEINLDYVICTSSITADSSGHLYISEDLGTSIIKLRLSDLAHWVFTESQGLNHPNGMIYEHDNNRLVVCEDRPNPSIMAVSLLDSSVTTLTTTTLAGSDGIARDINGIYYLTGYFLNGIYRFDSDFSEPPQLIFYGSGIPFPTYDPSDNSLLITYFELDDWARVPIPVSNGYHFTDQIKGFELFQNYPNPFNPSTKITYSILQRSAVSLKVFDVLGNEVAWLVDEVKPSGDYQVEFSAIGGSASDGDAWNLSSGIYFYKLIAGGFVQTKKMILIK